MKPQICENCGSTEFHETTNGWKCDYCKTVYIAEKAKPKIDTVLTLSKVKWGKLILAVFLVSLTIFIGKIFIRSISSETAEPSKPAEATYTLWTSDSEEKDISSVSGWSQSVFDAIQVATEEYNEKTEKYSYTNGGNYADLEKIVGKPTSRVTWEQEEYGHPAKVIAEWQNNESGEYAGMTVTVTYNKKTLMIIDKDVY